MDNFKVWIESKIDEAVQEIICAPYQKDAVFLSGYIKAMAEVLKEWRMVKKDGNE